MIKRKCILAFLTMIALFLVIPGTSYAETAAPTYRALLIGNSNYWDNNNLQGPTNDLVKMENALSHHYYGSNNTSFSTIKAKRDVTKQEIISSIRETFKDAQEGDISYFYYSGHGAFDYYSNSAYLIGVDGEGLGVHELEMELGTIPGTIVVVLDSCHSGGFINKELHLESSGDTVDEDYINDFNHSIVDIFAQKKSRNYLTSSKYKVITAASKYEYSYDISYLDGWGWGGEFTRAFVTGNGYNGNFTADTNLDFNITLNEIYNYASNHVKNSNVQVWPQADNFIIGSDFGDLSSDGITVWDTFIDTPIDKIWNIKFNLQLDENSWKNKIYVLDTYQNKLPTRLEKSANGQIISIIPSHNYDYSSPYTIVIENGILAASGSQHKKKVLAYFITEKNKLDYEELALNTVLSGYFYSHPYPSVQEAFESFFGYPTWDYFYSTDGSHVVEFNGNAYKNYVYGTVTIQFTVDVENESFSVNYAAFDSDPMSYYEFEGLLDVIYTNYFYPRDMNSIDDIFIDEDDSPVLDEYKDLT